MSTHFYSIPSGEGNTDVIPSVCETLARDDLYILHKLQLLQLLLGPNNLLHLGKLVVKVQALRIQQCPARLDFLSRHDLLDR